MHSHSTSVLNVNPPQGQETRYNAPFIGNLVRHLPDGTNRDEAGRATAEKRWLPTHRSSCERQLRLIVFSESWTAGEALLPSGGVETKTQCKQTLVGLACLDVVPDRFSGASFIAVLFTPGRPKVNYATESLVVTFREYQALLIIAFLSGVSMKNSQ